MSPLVVELELERERERKRKRKLERKLKLNFCTEVCYHSATELPYIELH